MTLDVDALARFLREWVDGHEGRAALVGAVQSTLTRTGAPTRPGGDVARLADRLARREPLAEDTDWRAPLGPFRDGSIEPGTVRELCAARLHGGGFAGDVLLGLLVPAALARAGTLVAGAMDEADARDACVRAWARVLSTHLGSVPLPSLLSPEGDSPVHLV